MKRVAIVVAVLATSLTVVHAGGYGSDGASVRDHRSSSDSGPSVRDHRSESSSSSSSSSDSDSSSSSATTTSESKPACIDDTDVVGFRKCTKFGAWGANLLFPRIFVELGSNTRQFTSGLASRTGTVAHGDERFAFRTAATGGAQDTVVTSALRIGIGLSRGAYVGTELEIGGLVAPAAATAETMTSGALGVPSVEEDGGVVVGALGVAGYRVNSRRGALAVEGAGGVRSVRYKLASTYDNWSETTTIVDTRGVVEARARAELWLGPWATLGATAGGSVIAKGDWMAGMYLGLHTRAFAGGR